MRRFLSFGLPLLMAALDTGCGGDWLLLGLPDGVEVRYHSLLPSGNAFQVACDTANAAVWADPVERNKMKIRCLVALASANGQTIKEDPSIRIVAEIQEQGKKPADGRQVTFTTDLGSFQPFSPSYKQPVREIKISITSGTATANLYSFPGEYGTATVTASYETIGYKNVSDSVSVKVNLGLRALAENNCQLGRYPSNDGFVFLLSPTCDPLDVEPLDGEPYFMEGGKIYNPRDGILTMLFYVDGAEGFIDENNNGVYDAGESFTGYDQPEPFLDANDNGLRDEGENFIDLDGDGSWTQANGKHDDASTIWSATHIVFSGRPHFGAKTSRFEPSGINIAAGSTQEISLFLVDINNNPIAGTSGKLTFRAEGGASISGSDTAQLRNTAGVVYSREGVISVPSLTEERDYSLVLQDRSSSQPEAVTLRTTLEWLPAPATADYNPTRQTEQLPVLSGTAQ